MSLFPHSLKKALDRASRPITRKRGFSETRILTDWPQIVGEHLSCYATPLKLTFPRNQNNSGTLTLAVHPAYALELQQMTPMILEKMASYLGFRAIERITIEQSYTPLKEHTPELAPLPEPQIKISDDPLNDALSRLEKIRASKG